MYKVKTIFQFVREHKDIYWRYTPLGFLLIQAFFVAQVLLVIPVFHIKLMIVPILLGVTVGLLLATVAAKHSDVDRLSAALKAQISAEQKSHTLFEANQDGLMTLSPPDWCFTACNTATLKLFAVANELDFVHYHPSSLSPEYQPDGLLSKDKAEKMIQIALQETSHPFDWLHQRIDGTTFPATVRLSRIESDGQVSLLATVRDVSKQKAAEMDLLQALALAKAANQAKSNFLSTMSHEIRTPMNGILGMTEIVLDTNLNDEQREYIQIVKDSADALMVVINDILDFSKIEAGKLCLESLVFDVHKTVADSIRTLEACAIQKGLGLSAKIANDVPRQLIGDAARLRQVLLNLLANAVKFTNLGNVKLDVHCVYKDDKKTQLSFIVRDTGIGIPADKLEHIFEAFSQADNSVTRQYGGTGLGLAICSKLVEMMGGHIRVESELGQGSIFSFTATYYLTDTFAKEKH